MLWALPFILLLFVLTGEASALPPKKPVRKPATSSRLSFADVVQKMADFYAGKPVSVGFDAPKGYEGQTYPGADYIKLSPAARASLEALHANYGTEKGAYDGALGLTTLIHEALHTRGPDQKGTRRPEDGFYSWDDEWQARQLAASLVPDAAKRFFGIDPNSKLGQVYETAGRGRGFTPDLGAPKTPQEQQFWGKRTEWF